MASQQFSAVILLLLVLGSQAQQLNITSIAIGTLSRDIVPGQNPSYIDVKPTSGPNADSYQVQVQMQNVGEDDRVVSQEDIRVYVGSYDKQVPATAQVLQIDTTGVSDNLPTITANGTWPNGISFLIPGTAIPETTACSPFDITIALNTTHTTTDVKDETSELDLAPVRVVPKCLSVTPTVGNQLSVSATFVSPYVETNEAELPFLINFGEKVLELNPLKLFNLTGSSRADVVYEVEYGKIYLMVYPDSQSTSALITVEVPAGVTTTSGGIPNSGAVAVAQYKPKIGAIRTAGLAMGAVFGGVVLASWTTSFVVSSIQPWATAGSLGYGAIGFILWAQKLYMTGLMSPRTMPANYRTLSDIFAWADFQEELPWQWGSSSTVNGVPSNLTKSNTIFENNAQVLLDTRTDEFVFYYPSGGSVTQSPPTPAPAPAPVPAPPPLTSLLPEIPTVPIVTAAPPGSNASALAPAIASPDSCSVLQNTDFFGGDIPGALAIRTTNPQECCDACLANPLCFVWTLSIVQNQCFLKGQAGWQQNPGMTCCLSGTANRGGITPFLPGTVAPAPSVTPAAVDSGGGGSSSGGGGGSSNNNNNNNGGSGGGGSNNNNNNKNGGGGGGNRRLLSSRKCIGLDNAAATSSQRSTIIHAESSRKLLQLPIINGTTGTALAGPDNTRYIVTSTAAGFGPTSQTLLVVINEDAGGKTQYIMDSASVAPEHASDGGDDVYLRLEQVGFWLGCVMGLAILFNLCAWLFVQCCQGEVPGVLHVPRMQLVLLMLVLCPLAFVGARLFSQGTADGIIPLVVGIAVVICGPVLFLLASYIGIAAALYRKRKAVYLLSSRAITEEAPDHSKWDLQVVASWMGMSLNRGKWRPADPSKKNDFVFRWGPLFEDCRGPLYQRRKVPANSNSSMNLRRHNSSASDQSSQNGMSMGPYAGYSPNELPRSSSSSSRKKVVALEEKPLASCGKRKLRRSGFQAYGVVVSLARMCAYGLAIGGLGKWAEIQTGVALFIAVAYFGYLRFAVPYSRRDEMALEYWISVLDIALFALLLVLAVATSDTDLSTIDGLGMGLIVVQCIEFASYLVNRLLIIVHAFMEVVCPACACSPPSPKKGRGGGKRSRRSRSAISQSEMSLSMSDMAMGVRQESFTPDGKGGYYLGDGKESSGSDPMASDDAAGGGGGTNGGGVYMTPPGVAAMNSSSSANGRGVAVVGGALVGAAALAGASGSSDGGGGGGDGSTPVRTNSRSARQGMFPAIAEESETQLGGGSSNGGGGGATLTTHPLQFDSPTPQDKGKPPVPPKASGSSTAPVVPPPLQLPRRPSTSNAQNAVFDKFWKSL